MPLKETTVRNIASQRVETPMNEGEGWEGWLAMWVSAEGREIRPIRGRSASAAPNSIQRRARGA